MKGAGLAIRDAGPAVAHLSGGEAQRIKLVTELSKVRTTSRGAARPEGAAHALRCSNER